MTQECSIRYSRLIISLAFAGLLASMGCATAKIDSTRRYVSDLEIKRPSEILVYDFAVSSKDVVVDRLGPEFASGEADPEERQALGREVANAFAEAIVAELRDREIQSSYVSRKIKPPLDAILLKGEFLSVDEGDRAARMSIGFGLGKSEVRVHAHVFQQTSNGAKLISVAEANASGSKMPGMLLPTTIGASLGTAATSAIVSGAMGGLRELKGPLGADVKRMAEEIAERVEHFYERRGWL